ncbi:hypothetical protein EGW08_012108 [Elysia chlorotica]|uniref:Uncharacterized protein n=1 Tax=Elysia chlorotica TaxID=188477 RepID=A0A3S1A168_ELYCH|nr:hypothetical protein EGW08_012108 [Elysia chlorotica]
MADDKRSEPILTELHVIIIACVCGVIIVTLLVILFCFIFRRRRNAAKNYESGTPAGDPPPYTSVNTSSSGPHKKPSQNNGGPAGGGNAILANSGGGGGYDNQGMDTSDLQLNDLSGQQQQHCYDNNNLNISVNTGAAGDQYHHQHHHHQGFPPQHQQQHQRGMSPSGVGGMHASASTTKPTRATSPPGFTNSSYGPLELQHVTPQADDAAAMLYVGRHQQHPGMRGQPSQQPQSSPRRLAEEEKHLYENQLNQWSENNRMESYPHRDAQSPNKDKYIDLHDRGGGGDMLDYAGGDPNSQPGAGGGGKPKKVIYEVVV